MQYLTSNKRRPELEHPEKSKHGEDVCCEECQRHAALRKTKDLHGDVMRVLALSSAKLEELSDEQIRQIVRSIANTG